MTEFDPMSPENRQKYIGASDVPIIMGESPWKTPFQLWEEKMGISVKIESNEHIERGNKYEKVARSKFEMLTGEYFDPAFVKKPDIEWAAANLDGISSDGTWIVEIKCPSPNSFKKLVDSREIPLMYQMQMTYQAFVSKCKRLTFFAYEVESGDYFMQDFEVQKEVLDSILEECEYFWSCVQNGEPPEGSERNYPRFTSKEHEDLAAMLNDLQNERYILDKKIKTIKNELIDLCGGESARLGDAFVFEKTFRKGSINYSDIPELKKVDLEKYRNVPVEVWRLK